MAAGKLSPVHSGSGDGPPPSEAMIGNVLGHLRRAEGLSEADLADAVGLSVDRIAAFEAGEARLDYDSIRLIADALNFDAGEFVRALGAYHRFRSPPERR